MGLADYVLWDDDIDAHDGPIRGRLDVLQLSAVSDILARRISVLRKDAADFWRICQMEQPCDEDRRMEAGGHAFLTVGEGDWQGAALVELLPAQESGHDEHESGSELEEDSDGDDETSSSDRDSDRDAVMNRRLDVIASLPTPTRAGAQ